jgi:hypothetical protein
MKVALPRHVARPSGVERQTAKVQSCCNFNSLQLIAFQRKVLSACSSSPRHSATLVVHAHGLLPCRGVTT